MQEAYMLASTSAEKAESKGRKQSDKRVRSTVILPGDRVLVRNLSPRGATPETKRVEKVKEQTPIIHTPEDSESDSEWEEGLSLPPNEMDELVQLSLRPESVNDATVDSSTNGDINQSREVHGNENEANRLNIQVEGTMETPGDVEETPPQPVRPQRQRQPPVRFGYNAPGCPT
ncbi:Hypothetical predicted protein [Paramuricea clavata]|uniref:Uncharacterized protein n=1 Tax=Paramuricea clavata TaxID=317549 RepID=A0A7D9LDB8_PARCT|nr:Hypothetical predicted protein [Paramuricea clavata]